MRPTLLGLAFDEANADEAEALLERARWELGNLALWQIDTTADDLAQRASQVKAEGVRERLLAVLNELRALRDRVAGG